MTSLKAPVINTGLLPKRDRKVTDTLCEVIGSKLDF